MTMKTLICVASIAVLSAISTPESCASSSFDVGGTAVTVPAPAGFVRITAAMGEIYELLGLFVPPSNVEFASYMAEQDAVYAIAGELPELKQRFTLQSVKSILESKLSPDDFEQIKQVIREQNQALIDQIKETVGQSLDDAADSINAEHGLQLAIDVADVVPLATHQDDDQVLAYSQIVKYTLDDALDGPSQSVSVVTATLVSVKGKLLLLYAHGAPDQLAWTREASNAWAAAVLSANR